MVVIRSTLEFDRWLQGLSDVRGRARIVRRLERLVQGNPGDARPVGQGVSELRINTGPGYRVYYLHERDIFILLLCGGDKSTQRKDIARAHRLADDWRDERPRGSVS